MSVRAEKAVDPARDPSLADLRRRLDDLFAPSAAVYWGDFMAVTLLGWGALIAAALGTGSTVADVALIVMATFAFLRAVLFIHELSHFRRGVLPGFDWAWNLLIGIPFALPSFMYVGTHTDHHKRHLYGTAGDPEYLPLAHFSRARVARFLVEAPAAPVLLVLRYGVLSPLSWLVPPLRRLVVERMSTLVINPTYRRRIPEGRDRALWIVQEIAVFLWLVGCGVALARGDLSARFALTWYAVAAGLAFVNQVRTLAAHRYENAGGELSLADQLQDSINVVGAPPLTELVFPVGLRFHALHHLVPDLPYHSLPAAHARLLADLPADAAYRRVNEPSLGRVLAALWRRTATSRGRRDNHDVEQGAPSDARQEA